MYASNVKIFIKKTFHFLDFQFSSDTMNKIAINDEVLLYGIDNL